MLHGGPFFVSARPAAQSTPLFARQASPISLLRLDPATVPVPTEMRLSLLLVAAAVAVASVTAQHMTSEGKICTPSLPASVVYTSTTASARNLHSLIS